MRHIKINANLPTKIMYSRFALLVFLLFVSFCTSAATNFIIIKLPESFTIDLPKNWILISNNKRITLDTLVESTFDLKQLSSIDSKLPFAANYYVNGTTAGIINSRYYPTMDVTQRDAQMASVADVRELDQELKQSMILAMKKVGITVTSWEGTQKRTINGITTFVSEYHRKSLRNDGIFRVRLVRVFAGKRSFTLTISYLESQAFFLKNITDRIISSLAMVG